VYDDDDDDDDEQDDGEDADTLVQAHYRAMNVHSHGETNTPQL